MRSFHIVLALAAAACPDLTVRAQTGSPAAREHYTLHFAPGAQRSLEIDTVSGGIELATHDAATVDVVVDRRVTARTEEARAAADRDVRLVVTDNAPALRLYVDGPFRDRDGRRDRHWPGAEVRYDFIVRVPKDVALRLRTVNGGDIRVRGVEGTFDVRNVNGAIDLVDVAGGGVAHTVNGDVRAAFRVTPRGTLGLKTLNGDVIARFGSAFSADVWMSTTNGDARTDYPYVTLPPPAPRAEQRGSKRIWRLSPRTGIRIGSGGPSLDVETFNGNIRILRSQS